MTESVPRILIVKATDEEFVLHMKDWNTLVIAIKKAAPSRAETVEFSNADTGEVINMLKLTTVQQCALSVDFLDAEGNPAPVDGAPVWSVANPQIGHVDVDTTDAKKAIFV